MTKARRVCAALLVALLVGFMGGAARADQLADGEKVFRKCAACHSNQAGMNKIGPSLAGVVGRKAGSIPGFHYSSAMQQSTIVWDEASLDAFLTDPAKFVPGTRMNFVGLRRTEDRAAVIAFLKGQAGAAPASSATAASSTAASSTGAAAPAAAAPAAAPAEAVITGGYVPN